MSKNNSQNESGPPENVSPASLLGIAILAGGLFNIPAVLKKPVTDSDWMMLILVVALILAGLLLFFLPGIIRKK